MSFARYALKTGSAEMKLSEQQWHFTSLIPRVIDYAYAEGFTASLRDAYRDPRATFPYSHPNSMHTKGLAIDLLLFKDGIYLTNSEAYRSCGEYWEGLHPECTWGNLKDGNHFSMYAARHGMKF